MSRLRSSGHRALTRPLLATLLLTAVAGLHAASETTDDNVFGGGAAGGTPALDASNNSVFGAAAGAALSTGTQNSLYGANAGNLLSTGTQNTYIGLDAGRAATTQSNNVAVGWSAGKANTGTSNVFVGHSAGLNNTSADANSFFGAGAGQSTTTSSNNSFFGYRAGFSNVGGSNSAFGHNSGSAITTGANNTVVGKDAGAGITVGFENAIFGAGAGKTGNGIQNAFFGTNAGANAVSTQNNTFVGSDAGLVTQFGTGNTFVGRGAGGSNVTGSSNTTLGTYADVGTNSTNAGAIGYLAKASNNNSLVLGGVPGVNGIDLGSPYVAVGMGTDAPGFPLHIKRADTTENMLRIEQASDTLKDRALMLLSNKGGTRFQFDNTATGNSWRFQAGTGAQNNFEITDVDAGTGVIELRLTDVGNLIIAGTLTQNSNVHDKTGIVPVDGAALLARVEALPISTWRYKNDAETPHVGPMAQDFYAAFKLGSDETKIAPGDMAGIALAAIKAQQAIIERQQAQIARLEARLDAVEAPSSRHTASR